MTCDTLTPYPTSGWLLAIPKSFGNMSHPGGVQLSAAMVQGTAQSTSREVNRMFLVRDVVWSCAMTS